jgi:hypothetical protein
MPSHKNVLEEYIRKEAENRGWRVYDKGWPDFLLYREGQAVFLEVKSCKSSCSKSQKAMHRMLKSLGLDVRVVRVGKKQALCKQKKVKSRTNRENRQRQNPQHTSQKKAVSGQNGRQEHPGSGRNS